jgi:hypothetical protein
MSGTPLSADAQGYLEDLMRAGQDAMKQFDDALASATGYEWRMSHLTGISDHRRPASCKAQSTGVGAKPKNREPFSIECI